MTSVLSLEEKVFEWLKRGTCTAEAVPCKADDLKRLVNGSKEARQVWDLLARRAEPGQKAEEFRAFRALKQSETWAEGLQEERAQLSRRRGELVRELSNLREAEARIVSECGSILEDVERGAASYRERTSCCDDRRQDLMILRQYRSKVDSEVALFREYARRLLKGVDMGSHQIDDPSSRERHTQTIMSLCENIAAKECALGGGGLDQATTQSVSRQGSTDLLQVADKPPQDSPAGGMRLVRDLLVRMQRDHVLAFEQIERTRLEGHSMRVQVRELAAKVDETVMMANRGADCGAMQCAVLRQQRELVAARAAAAQVKLHVERVRMRLEDKKANWETMKQGHTELQGLIRAVEQQQDLAGMLLSKNARRGDHLRELQRDLRDSCSDGIVKTGPDLQRTCQQARTAVLAEADLFASLEQDPAKIQVLLAYQGEHRTSVAGAEAVRTQDDALVVAMAEAMGMSRTRACGGLMRELCKISKENAHANSLLTWSKSRMHNLRGDVRFCRWGSQRAIMLASSMLQNMQQKVKRNIEVEVEPCVQTCEDAIKRCSKLKQLIQEWKDQPGQYAVPWHKIQGKDMRQWMDEFQQYEAMLMARSIQ